MHMTTVFYEFNQRYASLTFVVLCFQCAKALDDFADGIKVHIDFVVKPFLRWLAFHVISTQFPCELLPVDAFN